MKQGKPMQRTAMARGKSQLKTTKPMSRGTAPLRAKSAMKAGSMKKAPAQRSTLKARKIPPNAAESAWMDQVAQLGCIVCRQQGRGFVPCAVHHIVEGGRRLGHMLTIGLCDPGHHQNSPDPAQISRHPHRARFTAAYGSEYDLLKITQDLLSGKLR